MGSVTHPGRMEVVGRSPLIVLDGAHNVAGAQALAQGLIDEFATDAVRRSPSSGMLEGRDPSAMLDALAPAGVRTRRGLHGPFAAGAAGGVDRRGGARPGSRRRSRPTRWSTPSPWRGAGFHPTGTLVVTGSLYVVAEAREVLVGSTAWADPGSLSAPMNRTLVICKPDAVERGLSGEIIGRLERKGLRLVAARVPDHRRRRAAEHYEEHQGKPFYGELVGFITRSPSMVLVVEGPEDTWQIVRTLMGPTNPAGSASGDDPRRSRDDAHREPHPRFGLGRVGGTARSASSSRDSPDNSVILGL